MDHVSWLFECNSKYPLVSYYFNLGVDCVVAKFFILDPGGNQP